MVLATLRLELGRLGVSLSTRYVKSEKDAGQGVKAALNRVQLTALTKLRSRTKLRSPAVSARN